MFDLKNFIVTNIVNGIKKNSFAKEYGNIMAVNYLAKGLLTEDDVASIDAEITAWEEAKAITETVTETVTEESSETETEEVTETTEEYLETEEETVTENTESTENTEGV